MSRPTSTAPPRTGPVALVPVDAPDAGSPGCASLIAAAASGLGTAWPQPSCASR
jgi:hypothetical protein